LIMGKRFVWATLFFCILVPGIQSQQSQSWTKGEREIIRDVWIGNLERLAPDPSNRVSEDPRAARLGHRLFFDVRFSRNGMVACATCYKPELGFQDNLPLGVGIDKMNRRTMPIAGTAYSPRLFWDGRRDSQ
jgi:cytochrome c peroxidase